MMEVFSADLLNSYTWNVIAEQNFFLAKNTIYTIDALLTLGAHTYDGDYYSVGKQLNRPNVYTNGKIYASNIYLHGEQFTLSREVYNCFGLLGDLGGVTEVIMIVFGFIFYPISEHSYILTASQKLFFAKTSDDEVFAKEA